MGKARQFGVRGRRRALIPLVVVALVLGLSSPALGQVLTEQLSRMAAAKAPGHGPDQQWGTASADGENGLRNNAKADTLQSKYPPIKLGTQPPPRNDAKVVDVQRKVTGFDAATSKEVPEQRGERSRTFRNTDGTLTSEYAKDPLHFKAQNGKWQPIDTNLVADNGFRSAADSVTSRFAARADAPVLAKLELDADHKVEFGLSDAAPVPGVSSGGTVTYAGVRPHSDVRFEVEAGGFKEFLVLRDQNAPHVWRFPLTLTGLTAEIKNGDVVLKDKSGTERAVIPHGFMADSKKGETSGTTAESRGVRYELLRQNGRQVLQVSLDSAWLRDPARVYPVTVDPPVHRKDASRSMFVQRNGDGSSFSQGGGELRAGHVVDNGSFTAASYIDVPDVQNDLRDHRILGAQLAITNYHATSCSATSPITVHAVTQGWAADSSHRFPGPSYDATVLGSAEFAHGWIASGTTVSRCPTATELVTLGEAGRALVQRWVTGQQPNFGLTVRASETDPRSWKKFTGAGTANPPRLAITHSPYDAAYKFENPVPDPPVTRTNGGKVKITVTNRSAMDWSANDFVLAYRQFGASGNYIGWNESAPLPAGGVVRGASVTLDANILKTEPGTYGYEFSMLRRGVVMFTDEQVPPAGLTLRVENLAPAVQEQWPPNGYSSPSLTPTFWARAIDVDAPPGGGALRYRYTICDKNEQNCFDSGVLDSQTWTVPWGKLRWSVDYKWRVDAIDSDGKESLKIPFADLLTAVPQPEITAHLGTAPYSGSGGDFSPHVGNYTTAAIDATVTTVGPELSVNRTYNSLDPREDASFGAGWSSRYDMKITPDDDGSGNVVVTHPDGQQVRFGANLDAQGLPTPGRLAPPPGRWATLVPQAGGGWVMTDKSNTTHVFGADGTLRQTVDAAGRRVELTYEQGRLKTATNKTSNRTLTFTWSGNHVGTVTSGAVNGKTATWRYTYTGDRLDRVCDPLDKCTNYDYQQGTHFRSAVVDSGPDGYWRFREQQGTDVRSEVATNLGKDTGRSTDVTLTADGSGVAGSGDRAASFNGSTSAVTLPQGAIKKSREVTVELWFKTAGNGPLVGAQNTPLGTAPDHTVPVLYVGTDGKLRGQFWHGAVDPITSTGAVNNDQWHHVVLTSTVAKQWLYLDGALVGSRTGTIDNSMLTHVLVGASQQRDTTSWAAYGGTVRRHFAGQIDEVAIYQHTLGQVSVNAHRIARDPADQLSKVTLPSGKVAAEIAYDGQRDRMHTLVDRNGGKWTLSEPIVSGPSRETMIRTVRVIDPGNRAHFYEYDPLRGRILRYLAPLGMEARPEDRPTLPTTTTTTTPVTCVSQPDGQICNVPIGGGPGSFVPVDMQGARSYRYDEAGFQSTITDETGNELTLKHDKRGNVVSRTTCRNVRADCATTHFEFFNDESNLTDPRLDKVLFSRDGRSASATDNTYRTGYTYTQLGELETQTTPDGAVVRHVYTDGNEPAVGGGNTPAGLVEESTDPRGAKTKYRYHATGDLAEVTSPTGLVTTYAYDALGRRERTTQNGVTSVTTYDQLSRVDSVTQPPVKNVVTGVSHQLKVTTQYTADGFPEMVKAVDLTGGDAERITTTEYDDRNRVRRVVDAENRETRFGFDSYGNRTWTVGVDGVKYEYAYTARNMVSEVRLRGWRDQWKPAQPDEETRPVAQDDYLVVAAFGYDLAGELVSQTDAMGRKTGYRYYSDGLLKQTYAKGFRNENGSTRDIVLADFSYDNAGNTTKVVGTGNRVTTTEYDAVGRITATTADPDGLRRRSVLSYDLNGNVTKVVRTGNESNTGSEFSPVDAETVEFGHDAFGRQTSERVWLEGRWLTTTRGYNAQNQLTSVYDPRGATTTAEISYDVLGRVIGTKAPEVSVESGDGSAAVRTRPETKFGYNTFGQGTESVDVNGKTTRATFDKLGRLVDAFAPSYTPPGSTSAITPRLMHRDYDGAGNLAAVTDARGAVTRMKYDQMNRVVGVEHPDPVTPGASLGSSAYTYTRVGELLSVVNADGARAERTYDDLGRLVTSTQLERKPQAGTFTSRFKYSDSGDLLETSSPGGSKSTFSYDAVGALTKVVDPAGVPTHYGYDRAGRPATVKDALGRSNRTNYDLAGRATSSVDLSPAGQLLRRSSVTYDAAGNVETTRDTLNRTTAFTYDALSRLTQQTEPSSVTTSFGYDAAGNITRYTNGKQISTYSTFNSLGLPEKTVEPSTAAHPAVADRTWTTSYDTGGLAVRSVAPGGVTRERTFDLRGQLTKETGSGAEASTVDRVTAYDVLGRVTSVSAPGGTNTFTHNDRGGLLTTAGPSGASSFGYDSDGRLTSRSDASGASTYTYSNGRLGSVQDALTGALQVAAYNEVGQLKSLDYGAGRKREYEYDDFGRLKTDKVAGATKTYAYDTANQLKSATSAGFAGPALQEYGYDALGRLTSWKSDGVETAYGWDAAGNRTSAAGKTATYDERNRLLSDGTDSYVYSARGTTVSKGSQQSKFDAFNRLISQGAAAYSYDGLDRVVKRNATTFAYSGAGNHLASDGSSTFSRGPGADLLAVQQNGSKRLAVTNTRSDVVGSLDPATGSLTDTTSYDPFGKIVSGTKRPLGYQGDWTDPDTDQVNMSARWYDPARGAFSSRDSAALPANPSPMAHRYNYGAGAPTNFVDPSGMRPGGVTCDYPRPYPYCTWDDDPEFQHGKPSPPFYDNHDQGRSQGGDDCTALKAFGGGGGCDVACGGPGRDPAKLVSFDGGGGGSGCIGGSGDGSTEPGGRNPAKPNGYNYQPPPDPAIAARAENRRAAMQNPIPIPSALGQPLYGDSYDPPVSSTPETPSQQFADQVDPVSGVAMTYQKIEQSITRAEILLMDNVIEVTGSSELNEPRRETGNIFFAQIQKAFKDYQANPGEFWHLYFDLLGVVPGVGEIFDGLNAALYAIQGRWLEAGLSAAAMVPVAGIAATAGKLLKRTVGAVSELAPTSIRAGSGKSGPWVPDTGVTIGGAVSQSRPGSCGSACGEMVTGGAVTEAEFLDDIGEWVSIEQLTGALNRRGADPQWIGGAFPGPEQAVLVATNAPQAILLLWASGRRAGHFVVSEPLENGGVLIRDPDPGVTYVVDSDWISKYVAGGIFR
ncbi:DNRLRE domain-containing protein [Streptomyces sp. ID05-26A]|nr:DNRLRE domain-containing protein [Streptomyces sp. ID05-26A]